MSKVVPSVRWNEKKKRWMAFVRFPDGSRRKIERVEKADAERDLSELLALRASEGVPVASNRRQATFDEVITAWLKAGCPNPGGKTSDGRRRARTKRDKNINTVDQATTLLRTHVAPRRDLDTDEEKERRRRDPNPRAIGRLWVDRTATMRVEDVFDEMSDEGLSNSTIYRTWKHLDSALAWGVRQRMIKTNPADDCLLPEGAPGQKRRSFSVAEAQAFFRVIPGDRLAALWFTAVMVGLRPGELLGVRWPMLDVDSDRPAFYVDEVAKYRGDKYLKQGAPKTTRAGGIELHPLNVAALILHRVTLIELDLYDPEGFVFPTRYGTPMKRSNVRRYLRRLTKKAGIGENWTTYELRHSFASLADEYLAGNRKFVSKMMGHSKERTTAGYIHGVRPVVSHAVDVWNAFLEEGKATK